MPFLANLLQRPVVRSLSPEVSALGAAHLAGRALGVRDSQPLSNCCAAVHLWELACLR
ncbi:MULTISPECIES: hypothetical protein [Pseudomonas]|uniref:hypothetical protein n=1 Tax=Pseudomonas TaxID=286 RepID=UPI000307B24A|nr:hypothetical protein [Pseudomonas simiae]